MEVARGWGRAGKLVVHGDGASVWGEKNVLEMDDEDELTAAGTPPMITAANKDGVLPRGWGPRKTCPMCEPCILLSPLG